MGNHHLETGSGKNFIDRTVLCRACINVPSFLPCHRSKNGSFTHCSGCTKSYHSNSEFSFVRSTVSFRASRRQRHLPIMQLTTSFLLWNADFLQLTCFSWIILEQWRLKFFYILYVHVFAICKNLREVVLVVGWRSGRKSTWSIDSLACKKETCNPIVP